MFSQKYYVSFIFNTVFLIVDLFYNAGVVPQGLPKYSNTVVILNVTQNSSQFL